MIVRNGVRYRYYRDEGGEILYDSEPEEGKPEWCSALTEHQERDMEYILKK